MAQLPPNDDRLPISQKRQTLVLADDASA